MRSIEARCDSCAFYEATHYECRRLPNYVEDKFGDDWCGEFEPLRKHYDWINSTTKEAPVTKWPPDKGDDA